MLTTIPRKARVQKIIRPTGVTTSEVPGRTNGAGVDVAVAFKAGVREVGMKLEVVAFEASTVEFGRVRVAAKSFARRGVLVGIPGRGVGLELAVGGLVDSEADLDELELGEDTRPF